MIQNNIWEEHKQKIQTYLAPQKRLLWSGRPRFGIVFRSSDIFMIPFSLLWGGMAIFTMLNVLVTDRSLFSILPMMPFVAIGLYLIFGRFIHDAKLRAKTYYGVTNERIIIVSGLFSRKIKSLSLRTLTDLSIDEKSDGSGTITFGPTKINPSRANWLAFPGGSSESIPSFELIDGAMKVYEMITTAQRSVS